MVKAMIVSVCAGLGSVALAGDPCCEQPACELPDVSAVEGWSCPEFLTTISPDRRPVKILSMYGFDTSCGWNSIRPEMRECDDTDSPPNGSEAFDWLVHDQLDYYYAQGWRRFVILMPAGVASTQQRLFSSSQWWTMPDWMRDEYSTRVAGWIDNHTDATVGIYAGWRLNDPCDLCMGPNLGNNDPYKPCENSDEPHAWQCDSDIDAQTMYLNIRPWIDEVGIYEYWLDAASEDKEEYLAFSQGASTYFGSLQLGMESIAFETSTTPDDDYLEVTRSLNTARLLKACAGDIRSLSTTSVWSFGATATVTEVGVNLDQQEFGTDSNQYPQSSTPADVLDIVKAFHAHGYVFWVNWDIKYVSPPIDYRINEAVKRVSWPGNWGGVSLSALGLCCPEDLNMDDSIDSADYAIITANWGGPNRSLAQGDVTGDGYVNGDDVSALNATLGLCPVCN